MADAARKPRLIQLSEFCRPAFSVFKTEKTESVRDIRRREERMRLLGGTRERAGATPGFVRPGRPKPQRNFRSQGSLQSLGRSRPSPLHSLRANQNTLVAGRLPRLVAHQVPDLVPAKFPGRCVVAGRYQPRPGLTVDTTVEEKPWR